MSNAYDSTRGNVTDRQRRKLYLLETYAADMAIAWIGLETSVAIQLSAIPIYEADGDLVERCCRCYRCGKLLTLATLTVDRIKPGCKGGTYRRDNIRPSCSECANKQGGQLSAENRNQVPVVRPGVSGVASRNTRTGRRGKGPVAVPEVQAPGESDLRRNGQVGR